MGLFDGPASSLLEVDDEVVVVLEGVLGPFDLGTLAVGVLAGSLPLWVERGPDNPPIALSSAILALAFLILLCPPPTVRLIHNNLLRIIWRQAEKRAKPDHFTPTFLTNSISAL